jgi:hypothetical protein
VVDAIKVENIKDLSCFTVKENKSLKEECAAITQFGDGHFDENVNPSITNRLNEYNPTIARIRTEKYFSRLIYMLRLYRRAGIKVNNLILHLVGDFISGWIHEELVQTNKMSPIVATLFAEELLIKGIKTIAEYSELKEIVVICTCGNHSRITKRNQFKNAVETSHEYWMYSYMSDYFKDKGYNNIKFVVSEAPYVYYDVYGRINKFSHGNHFQYQGGIGGIEVPLKKWIHRENTVMPFDMAWIGHWHQYMCGSKVRINGSVIGYSEYARAYGFAPEPPQMQFQLLDKKRGYTWNCPIILTDWA